MSGHANDGPWSILRGEHDGRPILVRLNTGARAIAGSDAYGIRVGVAIPFRQPTPEGMPDTSESAELLTIEDALIEQSSAHAVLVAILTTNGMREFVFYTGDGDWIPEFHQHMMRSTSSHEVQCIADHDPSWEVYRQLSG